MKNKGNKSARSYIAVVIILICALVFIFYLLESEKDKFKAKPMTEKVTKVTKTVQTQEGETTTTTILVDNNEGVTTPINVEPVSNFQSNLREIIGDLGFFGNYNVTTFYHGVEFTFKCTSYSEELGECSAGSALMKINDALYPLYTYNEEIDNYLLRGEDYYILLNDDFVLLYAGSTSASSGEARIFDNRGVQIGTLKNTLTSYKINDRIYNKLYPNIEDGIIYYYSCDNNTVVIKSSVLGNYDAQEILETIEGSCY